METAEKLKNEEPADDDVEAIFLKGLLWNSTSPKYVQSQVESSSMSVFTIPDQVIGTAISAIPTSSGNFMSNNSAGGPAHEVEFLDTMEL
eukprot:7006965-Ditylum_brightwellii.AAC.1